MLGTAKLNGLDPERNRVQEFLPWNLELESVAPAAS
jgi:hypothetical protein